MFDPPDPFIDMENAMSSSCGTTFPVLLQSNTLKMLFMTTSASHLRETPLNFVSPANVLLRKHSSYYIHQLRSTNLSFREVNPEAVPKCHYLQVSEVVTLRSDIHYLRGFLTKWSWLTPLVIFFIEVASSSPSCAFFRLFLAFFFSVSGSSGISFKAIEEMNSLKISECLKSYHITK